MIESAVLKHLLIAALSMTLATGAAAEAESGPGDGSGFGFSDPGGQQSATDLVKVQVTSDTPRIQPGKRFHLAIVFDIEPKWHIYWKNPGDSGAATDVRVQAPDGFTVGPTQFTRPARFKEGEDTTFGYAGQAVLFIPITAPETLAGEQYSFQTNINFLVCKNICLIGRTSRQLTLSVARHADATDASVPQVVQEHQKRLPRPINTWSGADVRFDGSTLTITGPAESFRTAEFFPVERPGVTFDEASVTVRDKRVRIDVPVTIKPANAQGKALKVMGLIALGSSLDDPCYEFSIDVDEANHAP